MIHEHCVNVLESSSSSQAAGTREVQSHSDFEFLQSFRISKLSSMPIQDLCSDALTQCQK